MWIYRSRRHPRVQKNSALISFWCLITQLENLIKIVPKLIPLLFGVTVIADRYILDMLVDGTASIHETLAEPRLGFRLLLRLLPKPDKAFLIEVDPRVAFRRKPDLPRISDYTERLSLYRQAARPLGVIVLDGGLSVEEIQQEIRDKVAVFVPKSQVFPRAPIPVALDPMSANHRDRCIPRSFRPMLTGKRRGVTTWLAGSSSELASVGKS